MGDVTLNQVGVQNALALGAAAVGLTFPTDLQPTRAIINVEAGAAIRWRADGTDPTATVGQRVPVGTSIDLLSFDARGVLRRIRFISDTGATATLEIAYFA